MPMYHCNNWPTWLLIRDNLVYCINLILYQHMLSRYNYLQTTDCHTRQRNICHMSRGSWRMTWHRVWHTVVWHTVVTHCITSSNFNLTKRCQKSLEHKICLLRILDGKKSFVVRTKHRWKTLVLIPIIVGNFSCHPALPWHP